MAPEEHTGRLYTEQLRTERLRDEALEDSFPASDPPPTSSGITGAEPPDKASNDRSESDIPTGLPNSDRHATETAHQSEDEVEPSSKQ